MHLAANPDGPCDLCCCAGRFELARTWGDDRSTAHFLKLFYFIYTCETANHSNVSPLPRTLASSRLNFFTVGFLIPTITSTTSKAAFDSPLNSAVFRPTVNARFQAFFKDFFFKKKKGATVRVFLKKVRVQVDQKLYKSSRSTWGGFGTRRLFGGQLRPRGSAGAPIWPAQTDSATQNIPEKSVFGRVFCCVF